MRKLFQTTDKNHFIMYNIKERKKCLIVYLNQPLQDSKLTLH